MKKIILLALLQFIMTAMASAQLPIGQRFDCKGYPLNGFFDPLTYSPAQQISTIHNSDSYEVGYYYDKSGNKVSGMIKFQDNKILFKEQIQDFRNKIIPEDIENFVIGVDSFFTVSNYYYQKTVRTEPVFVQFIARFDHYTFAKHYHFRLVYPQGQSRIVETFLVKSDDSDIWENFSDRNDFKDYALKYFGHIPSLKEKILSGKYNSSNMLSMIKIAEYCSKYEHSEPIYYDAYWQETRDKEGAEYRAIVTGKNGPNLTLEFYDDSVKLYRGTFYSFYPFEKTDDFIAYYPNGGIRQTISYLNNKAIQYTNYDQSGRLVTRYRPIEEQDDISGKTTVYYEYLEANDSLGNNILNPNGLSKQTIYDRLSGITYTSEYYKKYLNCSYRLSGNDTVFQVINPKYNPRIASIQKKFTRYASFYTYDNALSVNAQGMILVSLLVDSKGHVLERKLLSKLHPELDVLVESFARDILARCKPYKVKDAKKTFEVVIPFYFGVNRFYRSSSDGYVFRLNSELQHQMMMQQIHSQGMRNF